MSDEELRKRAIMVSEAIGRLLPVVRPEGLYDAARHLVDAGGKRLRPSLLLIAAEAVGADSTPLVPAAVSIELVHNFTLIHDDIMDNASLRRGRPSVHVIWGESGAILAGDTLYSKAFQILAATPAHHERVLGCMEMLAKTCTAICEGQWLDLDFEKAEQVDEGQYMEMIEKKTGVLYGASAWMGGMLGGADQEQLHGLEEFGRLTGMGFQIHDDVLDMTVSENVLGKRMGGDILEGKKTLIMIDALSKGVCPEIFGRGEASDEQIREAIVSLRRSGSIDYARRRSEELVSRGKDALDVLDESPAKALLLELADYMIRRGY
ncbi:MAG TPA: polyprenyl synthetase family protein [Methanotrichaceae archaeon]|nr:polyprenyl synthetase family protein [Methanotrichaceae archaeon]HQF17292.1 polyprenyl synthetase family protein [Methanotrichaceae archaeon]HQI91865.1 polyprenyl synthetase family protein [Methanotrichaceae archaeon]HQJ29195.1 polyprenyl synthetase family protein [Methanotrichaceae archaeon]